MGKPNPQLWVGLPLCLGPWVGMLGTHHHFLCHETVAMLPISQLLFLAVIFSACTAPAVVIDAPSPYEAVEESAPSASAEAPAFAIVIHGGAGSPSRNMNQEQLAGLTGGMAHALQVGLADLRRGADAVDVVERVITILETNPNFNAGRGAVFTDAGRHELDASIMDGETLSCGAVGGVTTVEHPISLARLVMDETRHVLFVADGAEAFADSMGERITRVDNTYFDTDGARANLRSVQERRREENASKTEDDSDPHEIKGTVGCVVLDMQGHLAAGTSTGGLTAKSFGRIGDSPIIGAGTYANDKTCAISCTGVGEEYIRHGVARDIAARVEYLGIDVIKATDQVVHGVLKKGEGGVIGIDKDGNIAMSYNTGGMVRAVGDSNGRFDIGIWEDFIE
jgi:L-asparaginase / beta-aspartyl-peptidase